VVVAARELSELTVLQELLLKLVMVASDCNPLLLDLLFITRVVAAGAVLMLAHCCLTPVLVEQAAVVLAGLVRLEQEPTEL